MRNRRLWAKMVETILSFLTTGTTFALMTWSAYGVYGDVVKQLNDRFGLPKGFPLLGLVFTLFALVLRRPLFDFIQFVGREIVRRLTEWDGLSGIRRKPYVPGHRRRSLGARWGWSTLAHRVLGSLGSLGWLGLLAWGLVQRLRYSTGLAERLVCCAVRWLPASCREQYEAEWLAELDWLKQQRAPMLGWAVTVLATALFTRLELNARLAGAAGRLRTLPQSPISRAIGRHKPIGLGVIVATGTFCMWMASWSSRPGHAQLAAGVAGSMLAGAAVTWQAWPRRPAPQKYDGADERDRNREGLPSTRRRRGTRRRRQ